MKKILMVSTMALTCVLVSGCASIVDGGRKSVKIDSNPSGAKFTVYDEKGTLVISQTTPAKIKLERFHNYFDGEDYKLVFEYPGYYPGETFIKHKIDGWYFGNIIFGGLIGLVVVDPLTGSMWTLSPRKLDYNLVSTNLNLGPEELKEAQLKANSVKIVKPATTPPAGKK
jgi:hypothetical protein